jgi:isoleucyl-tRNA synthetase
MTPMTPTRNTDEERRRRIVTVNVVTLLGEAVHEVTKQMASVVALLAAVVTEEAWRKMANVVVRPTVSTHEEMKMIRKERSEDDPLDAKAKREQKARRSNGDDAATAIATRAKTAMSTVATGRRHEDLLQNTVAVENLRMAKVLVSVRMKKRMLKNLQLLNANQAWWITPLWTTMTTKTALIEIFLTGRVKTLSGNLSMSLKGIIILNPTQMKKV